MAFYILYFPFFILLKRSADYWFLLFPLNNFQLSFDVVFRIRHFAGTVTYSIKGFIEKNLDKIPKHISFGLYQSKLNIVQNLFPEGEWNFDNSMIREGMTFLLYKRGNNYICWQFNNLITSWYFGAFRNEFHKLLWKTTLLKNPRVLVLSIVKSF